MVNESVHEDIGYSEAAMSPDIPEHLRSKLDSAMNAEPVSRRCSRSENIKQLRKARALLDSGRGEGKEAA